MGTHRKTFTMALMNIKQEGAFPGFFRIYHGENGNASGGRDHGDDAQGSI